MKYFLGIDGGGTKTSYLVIDQNKKIIKEVVGEGTSIDTYSIDDIKMRLTENISKLPYTFSGVFAGIGGVVSKLDSELIIKIIKSCNNVKGKVDAANDTVNALRGALDDNKGIVLIAGTGAVAYGRNGHLSHTCGGYGYVEGDVGSAYYLGFYALKDLSRVFDGRTKDSDFTRALSKEINCYNRQDLINYFNNLSRKDTAKLARIVTKYQNDIYAQDIILTAALEVQLMIKTVYNNCKFKKCKFSIIGGLGNANTLYKKQVLRNLPKGVKYVPKIYDANYGAALLALELTK